MFDRETDDGYFVQTEALSQQAAALQQAWADKKRYENITFFDPAKIMAAFSSAEIEPALNDISAQATIYKIVLAYTYFGIYYLIIPYEGNKRTKYYLYDLKTQRQVVDTGRIADGEYSKMSKMSIHDALQTGIGELAKLKHAEFIKEIVTAHTPTTSPTPTPLPKKPHLAFLYPDPIDEPLGYSHSLLKGFQKFDVEIDFLYLSEKNLTELDDKYNYLFIFTKIVKNQLCIENDNLTKQFVSIADFFEEMLWIDDNIIKGLFIFTSQPIDFSEVVTDKKPIANFVCAPHELDKMMKRIPHALFQKQQLNENKYCHQCLNIASNSLEKFDKAVHPVKINELKTALPEFIDRKAVQHHFVGREIDQ